MVSGEKRREAAWGGGGGGVLGNGLGFATPAASLESPRAPRAFARSLWESWDPSSFSGVRLTTSDRDTIGELGRVEVRFSREDPGKAGRPTQQPCSIPSSETWSFLLIWSLYFRVTLWSKMVTTDPGISSFQQQKGRKDA